MIASTVAFDHFTRQLARPEPGAHYLRARAFGDPVLRSATDPDDSAGRSGRPRTRSSIPNGATGLPARRGLRRPSARERLSSTNGDFDTEYTENAGSYYDKINTAILLAESEDRFVSQSRRDFYDARFRAVGMADVFPDGFRRVIANALTGDRSMLAPRLETDEDGKAVARHRRRRHPRCAGKLYPARPLGWTSFWPNAGPKSAFRQGRNACTNYARTGGFAPTCPRHAPVDPQIGWEVQKFFIAWTLALIKANEKTNWLDKMRLYRLGSNADPELDAAHRVAGPFVRVKLYYAQTSARNACSAIAADGCAGGKRRPEGHRRARARVRERAHREGATSSTWTAIPKRKATPPASTSSAGRSCGATRRRGHRRK